MKEMKSQLKWLATVTCAAVLSVYAWADIQVDNVAALSGLEADGGTYSFVQFQLGDERFTGREALGDVVWVKSIGVVQHPGQNNTIAANSTLRIQQSTGTDANTGISTSPNAAVIAISQPLLASSTATITVGADNSGNPASQTLRTYTFAVPFPLKKSTLYTAKFYNASGNSISPQLAMYKDSSSSATTQNKNTTIHANASPLFSPCVRIIAVERSKIADVGATATWSELWSEAPASTDTVGLNVTAANAALTMDTSATVAGLAIGSETAVGPLTFTGTGSLTSSTTSIATDTDVSAISADLGTVTLGTNKTLTVGNGYFPSGIALGSIPVSGGGTLALDLGASNSVNITGSNTTSGKTFGLLVKSGTLNFSSDSGGNGPAKGRIITVSGSNSVLKFSAKDATGWNQTGTRKIILTDGAKLQVGKRDTFSTPLTLQGATLELLNGANETSRGFDWFKQSNELSVLQALGAGAKNITESEITYASNAGENDKKFAVRIDDDKSGNYGFFVNVERYARLTIGVPIIKVGAGLAKIVKRGLGEMVITAAGTHGLPVTVEAGTLKLTGEGTLSTGAVTISSNANLTVEVDTSVTKTLSNAISGEGTVKKSGAGTLSLTGSVRTPVEVAAGTLDIGTNRPAVNALASGAVLKVKATVAELIAQRITFPVGAGLTTIADSQLLVVDNAGSAVADFSVAVADNTLTITLPNVPTLTVNADGTQTWTNNGTSNAWPTSGTVKIDATAVTEITETKTITFPASEASRFSEVFVLAPAGDLVTLAVEAGNTIDTLSLSGSVAMDVASANAATKIEVTDGATLTLSTENPAMLTAAISGAGALSVASGKITVGPVLAHTGGTEIVKGSTVVISAANALGTAKDITGGGIIETSVLPSCNLKNEEWTGTLCLTVTPSNMSDMDWRNYGNENSYFKISEGVEISGYFNPDSWELTAKVILDGTVTINDGYSGPSGNTYEFTGALTGSGTFTLSGNNGAKIAILLREANGFAGTLEIVSESTMLKAFIVGSGTHVYNKSKDGGKIIVTGNVENVAVKNWSAKNGILVEGTLATALTAEETAAETTLSGVTLTSSGRIIFVRADGWRVASTTATYDPTTVELPCVWTGGGEEDTAWATAANWSTDDGHAVSAAPNFTITALTVEAGKTVTLPAEAVSVTSLITRGDVALAGEADASLTTGDFTFGGSVAVGAGVTLHLQPTTETTVASPITGAGKVVIGDGSAVTQVTLAALRNDIAAIDILAQSTLTLNAATAGTTLPATATVDIAKNGKLVINTAREMNANVTGAGEVEANSITTYAFKLGQTNRLAPGKLTVTKALTLHAERAGTELSVGELCVQATLTSTNSDGIAKPVVKIANGQVLSGGGSIIAPIDFEDGAIFDAKDTVAGTTLNLTGEGTSITWPASGTVTVKASKAVQLMQFASEVGLDKFTLTLPVEVTGLCLAVAKGTINKQFALSVVKQLTAADFPVELADKTAVQEAIQQEVAKLAADNFLVNEIKAVTAKNTAGDEMGSVQAIDCFTNLDKSVSIMPDWEGGDSSKAIATVIYNFGVSQITVKKAQLVGDDAAQNYVLACAKVYNGKSEEATAAGYATGTTVSLLLDGSEATDAVALDTETLSKKFGVTAGLGERWFALPMKKLALGTRKFTVRATNTPQAEVTP